MPLSPDRRALHNDPLPREPKTALFVIVFADGSRHLHAQPVVRGSWWKAGCLAVGSIIRRAECEAVSVTAFDHVQDIATYKRGEILELFVEAK